MTIVYPLLHHVSSIYLLRREIENLKMFYLFRVVVLRFQVILTSIMWDWFTNYSDVCTCVTNASWHKFSPSRINFQPGNDFLYNEWSLVPEVSVWDSVSVVDMRLLKITLVAQLIAAPTSHYAWAYWLKIYKISMKYSSVLLVFLQNHKISYGDLTKFAVLSCSYTVHQYKWSDRKCWLHFHQGWIHIFLACQFNLDVFTANNSVIASSSMFMGLVCKYRSLSLPMLVGNWF